MNYRLHDLSWDDVHGLAERNAVVVIPLGATEQHGKHLPVEVDSRLVLAVAARAVEIAGQTIDILLAPPVYYGASSHHIEFAGTMSLSLPTYIQVLNELAESLIVNGFTHIFLLNGHGGNLDPIRIVLRMLRDRHPNVVVAGACYWDIARVEITALRKSPPGGMSHGCELETALMMHVHPEVVKREKIAKNIPEWNSEYLLDDLLLSGRVSLGYHTVDITRGGTTGDPTLSTPEHGKEFFSAISDRVASFLVEFSRWRMEGLVKRTRGTGP